MGDLIIHDLDDEVLDRIKQKTEAEQRSLEMWLREVVEMASRQVDPRTSRNLAEAWQRSTAGRTHSDSSELIREDRDR